MKEIGFVLFRSVVILRKVEIESAKREKTDVQN